jgi:hypothetical protein
MNISKLILLILILSSISYSKGSTLTHPYGINYLDPVPAANLVRPENNIIIGFQKPLGLNETEILNSIAISGTISGKIDGKVIKCSGNKKIIFKPSIPFILGETIVVKLTRKLLSSISSGKRDYAYSFNILSKKAQRDAYSSTSQIQGNSNFDFSSERSRQDNDVLFDITQLIVSVDNNPSNGYVFLAPLAVATQLTITTKDGAPYWYAQTGYGGDFKKQPNGNLTYFDGFQFKHYELDQNYHTIDTFYCGNGYITDIHELRVLGNGHAYVLAYDPEVVDMSQIISGGDTAAQVTGLIIQEVDQNKNVVFQWRSWDHFAITDAWHENLLAHNIDAVHGNAIEIDNDSNLIISSRHLDEITKINHVTGDIIWRFGGKHNQFTFLGDTLKFTYQHAVRRIANGNLTLYDNGNWHSPRYSRAVEYSLDTVNMTATRVWQFRHSPNVFGSWGGYVQRLDNGNTLIGWGGTNPAVTEVQPNGTTVFEASYPLGVFTYRAYKFDWNGSPVAINNQSVTVPNTFKLNQNYPNPFNPSTIIEFGLPKGGNTTLTIYDITGREVDKIINNVHLAAGTYKYSFNGSNLSSGIYFYRLEMDGTAVDVKKMMLIK